MATRTVARTARQRRDLSRRPPPDGRPALLPPRLLLLLRRPLRCRLPPPRSSRGPIRRPTGSRTRSRPLARASAISSSSSSSAGGDTRRGALEALAAAESRKTMAAAATAAAAAVVVSGERKHRRLRRRGGRRDRHAAAAESHSEASTDKYPLIWVRNVESSFSNTKFAHSFIGEQVNCQDGNRKKTRQQNGDTKMLTERILLFKRFLLPGLVGELVFLDKLAKM